MSDFDPTTNRIPFGMMTPEEQAALKEWPHGFEVRSASTGWICHSSPAPTWCSSLVYRGLPKPVVTSEWFNVYPHGPFPHAHSSRKSADESVGFGRRTAVLRIDTCNGVSTAHLEDA